MNITQTKRQMQDVLQIQIQILYTRMSTRSVKIKVEALPLGGDSKL